MAKLWDGPRVNPVLMSLKTKRPAPVVEHLGGPDPNPYCE